MSQGLLPSSECGASCWGSAWMSQWAARHVRRPFLVSWPSARPSRTRGESTELTRGRQALTQLGHGCSPTSCCVKHVGLAPGPWKAHLQLVLLCLLAVVQQNGAIPPAAPFWAARWALWPSQQPSLKLWVADRPSAGGSEGRVWDWGKGGRPGTVCAAIKALLTGNLKQWRVLLFLQIHKLKTAANDGKC